MFLINSAKFHEFSQINSVNMFIVIMTDWVSSGKSARYSAMLTKFIFVA